MLTGILCTDETCAGFTQMYDLYSGCWSKSILTAFDIDEEKLPDVLRAGSIIGTLTERAASQTGLSANTPVVQGVGDGPPPLGADYFLQVMPIST